MHALLQEILPPSGIEFITSLNLIPSNLDVPTQTILGVAAPPEFTSKVLCNVVVARSNLLRIFAVCEEPAPISSRDDEERERQSKVRRGTEPMEGEVEMDDHGEGFVNIVNKVIRFGSCTLWSRPSMKK